MEKNFKTKEQKQEVSERFYEPDCSSGIVEVKEWQIDDKGHHHLVVVGQKDLDAEIQLYKDMCDIKILVDRLQNGDVATIKMLSQEGIYGDVNDYPEEYHPAAGAQALHTLYENQPESVKKAFPTYELFKTYFEGLTDAMVEEMSKPKEELKAQEVKQDEQ